MKIRFGKADDLKSCRKFDPDLSSTLVQEQLKAKRVVLAIADKHVVGYLRYEWFWNKLPYLTWITVDTASRESGIAAEMLSFLTGQLNKKGHKSLLSSYQSNAPAAAKWHRSVGFLTCGKIDGLNEDRSKEIFCRLKI